MAKDKSTFSFHGTLDGLTWYELPGVEGVIVRRKSSPSRTALKTGDNFTNTRRNNNEFGGRATASGWIYTMLGSQTSMADHPGVTGDINRLLQVITARDITSEWGKRNVLLSQNPNILQGFSLNKKYLFDSVLPTPDYTLSRESGTATVIIPQLIPGLNFKPRNNHPYYCIQIVLGIVPDLFHAPEEKEKKYKPSSTSYLQARPESATTTWQPLSATMEQQTLELTLRFTPPDPHYSLILSVGLRYGIIASNGEIQQAPHAGSAKVLGLM